MWTRGAQDTHKQLTGTARTTGQGPSTHRGTLTELSQHQNQQATTNQPETKTDTPTTKNKGPPQTQQHTPHAATGNRRPSRHSCKNNEHRDTEHSQQLTTGQQQAHNQQAKTQPATTQTNTTHTQLKQHTTHKQLTLTNKHTTNRTHTGEHSQN